MVLSNQQWFSYRVYPGNETPYVEPPQSMAAIEDVYDFTVPISTNNFAVNLATFFPGLTASALMWITIRETTAPTIGFNFGFDTTTNYPVRALSTYAVDGPPICLPIAPATTLPTFYFGNTSSTVVISLRIRLIGS